MRRITLLGCGSSVHAALLAKYAIERWARMPVEVAVASEYRYADPLVGPDTLCIAITQSGETADTLAATRLAREHGAPVIAVTNVVGSAITRVADAVLYLQAGPEISVTATKTFVTTTTVLYLAGLWLGRHLGALHPQEMQEMLAALQAIPGQMERLLAEVAAARRPRGPDQSGCGGPGAGAELHVHRARAWLSAGDGGRAQAQRDLLHPCRGLCRR